MKNRKFVPRSFLPARFQPGARYLLSCVPAAFPSSSRAAFSRGDLANVSSPSSLPFSIVRRPPSLVARRRFSRAQTIYWILIGPSMPPRECRLIRIASDARTGARINRFHEQVDAVAAEATSNSTALASLSSSRSLRLSPLFLSLSLSPYSDAIARVVVALPPLFPSVVSMELSTRLLAKLRQLESYRKKKPITVMHRKNASAAKRRAAESKSDG